jgi:hypothetical protein
MKDKKLYFNYRYLYKKLEEDIQKGRALNEVKADFIVTLIMGWIERQLD